MIKNAHKSRAGAALIYGALLLFSLVVHLPSLKIPFQFDDFHHIKENPAIFSLENIPRFFVDTRLFSGRAGEGMYRPLLMVTHTLNAAVHGLDPIGFHLVNIFLHLLNATLVLSLLRRWVKSDTAALLTALFWAAAAVQQEAVAYLSARSTLLSVFFMLAAVRVTDLSAQTDKAERTGWVRSSLAAFLCALGLLTKEIAFVLPLLLLLRDATLLRGQGLRLRSRWRLYLVTFALMPAYMALRFFLYSSVLGPAVISRTMYAINEAKVFLWYLEKALWPVNITLLPGIPFSSSILHPPLLASLIGLAALLLAGVLLIRRRPFISFAIFWFTVCLLPTSTLAPLFRAAAVERIYLALLGPLAALAAPWTGAEPGRGRRAFALGCAILIILVNAGLTAHKHLKWRDEIGLMREMVKGAPERSTPWTWLGLMHQQKGDNEKAKDYLLRALIINPDDTVAHETLGKLYIDTGQKETARQQLIQFLDRPAIPEDQKVSALLKLALIEMEEGELEKAEERLYEVKEVQPENSEAEMLFGRVAERRGDLLKAEDHYHRALEIYPEYPEVQARLGVVAFKMGRLARARARFMEVVDKGYQWPEVLANLGLIAFSKGQQEEARRWFEKTVTAAPDYPHGYYGLGAYYAVSGDLHKAREQFETAISKDPEFIDARKFLARVYMDLAERAEAPAERKKYMQLAAEQIRWFKQRGLDTGEEISTQWRKLKKAQ